MLNTPRGKKSRIVTSIPMSDRTNGARAIVFDSLKEKRGIVTANLTTPYIGTARQELRRSEAPPATERTFAATTTSERR